MQAHKLDLHIHDITLITKPCYQTQHKRKSAFHYHPFINDEKTVSVPDIGHKDHPPAVVDCWQKEQDGSSGSQFCRRLSLTAQTWKACFFLLLPEGLRGFYQWTSFILLEDWVNCKTKKDCNPQEPTGLRDLADLLLSELLPRDRSPLARSPL